MSTGDGTRSFLVSDPAGRARYVRVRVDGGRVAVTTPPGEGWTMTPRTGRDLAAAIAEACDLAAKRGASRKGKS